MADLTIGQIIERANSREKGVWCTSWSYREWECWRCGRWTSAVLGTADAAECGFCGALPPTPRVLGTVTAVDRERGTITVSTTVEDPHPLSDLRGPVVQPPPLTMAQLRKWTLP